MSDNDLKVLREEVANLRTAISEANREIYTKRQSIAEQTCPLKLGEAMEYFGWGFVGKRFVPKTVRPHKWGEAYGDWEVSGPLVKSDGTEGARIVSANDSDYARFLKKAVQP